MSETKENMGLSTSLSNSFVFKHTDSNNSDSESLLTEDYESFTDCSEQSNESENKENKENKENPIVPETKMPDGVKFKVTNNDVRKVEIVCTKCKNNANGRNYVSESLSVFFRGVFALGFLEWVSFGSVSGLICKVFK